MYNCGDSPCILKFQNCAKVIYGSKDQLSEDDLLVIRKLKMCVVY